MKASTATKFGAKRRTLALQSFDAASIIWVVPPPLTSRAMAQKMLAVLSSVSSQRVDVAATLENCQAQQGPRK